MPLEKYGMSTELDAKSFMPARFQVLFREPNDYTVWWHYINSAARMCNPYASKAVKSLLQYKEQKETLGFTMEDSYNHKFRASVKAFCLRWADRLSKLSDNLPSKVKRIATCLHTIHHYPNLDHLQACKSVACPYCMFHIRVLPTFLNCRTLFDHDSVPWRAYFLDFDLGKPVPFALDGSLWSEQFKQIQDYIHPYFSRVRINWSETINIGNTVYKARTYLARYEEGGKLLGFQPKVKLCCFTPDKKLYDFSNIYIPKRGGPGFLPTFNRQYRVSKINSHFQLAKYIGNFFKFQSWWTKFFTLYLFSCSGPDYILDTCTGSPLRQVNLDLEKVHT